jgi:hypothetical protein
LPGHAFSPPGGGIYQLFGKWRGAPADPVAA